jgi:cytoskeleton protein RodZ
LKLVVGNARGVRLTYDDKPVDLTPHIGVTVARLTLP